VTGQYFYDGHGTSLALRGWRKGTHAELEEYVGVKVTGHFSGDFDGQQRLAGTWRRDDQGSPKSFEMSPILPRTDGSPVLVGDHHFQRNMLNKKRTDNCKWDYRWPEIFGLEPLREDALNKRLRPSQEELSDDCREAHQEASKYEIGWNKSGFLSIVCMAYGSSDGHAGAGAWSVLFTVPDGKEFDHDSIWVSNANEVLRPSFRRAAMSYFKLPPDATPDTRVAGHSLDDVKALVESVGTGEVEEDAAWVVRGDGVDFLANEKRYDDVFLHLTKSEVERALAPQSPLRKIWSR